MIPTCSSASSHEEMVQAFPCHALFSSLHDHAPVDLDPQFPRKLHQLLEHAENANSTHVITWLPLGKTFRVHQPDVFSKTMLPDFFPNLKKSFRAFQQSLQMWGFQTFSDAAIRTRSSDQQLHQGASYHPLFVRTQPKLCALMSHSNTSSMFRRSRGLMIPQQQQPHQQQQQQRSSRQRSLYPVTSRAPPPQPNDGASSSSQTESLYHQLRPVHQSPTATCSKLSISTLPTQCQSRLAVSLHRFQTIKTTAAAAAAAAACQTTKNRVRQRTLDSEAATKTPASMGGLAAYRKRTGSTIHKHISVPKRTSRSVNNSKHSLLCMPVDQMSLIRLLAVEEKKKKRATQQQLVLAALRIAKQIPDEDEDEDEV